MSLSQENISNRNGKVSPWAMAGIFAGAGVAAIASVRRRRAACSLHDKVVLITGSRGLGLAIAQELGRRGAIIALCARDPEELRRACEILEREQIDAAAFPADINEPSSVPPLLAEIVKRFGRLDILVNNAGAISVGPFDDFQREDFERAMNLMFWAAINLTLEALPYMRKQGSGQIVNITSVGGRISIPHLLPYSCAKFALVGFSTGLSAELRQQDIHVLTVVPGLMRTGSYLNAQFGGRSRHEFTWFGLLGNLPGFSVAAEYAARSVADAIQKRRYICTISLPAKILIASEAILPETTRGILATANRFLLPKSGESKSRATGSSLDSESGDVLHALTTLGKRAAKRLNQPI
ncbi:MAG: SDR family oxidoreductase [Acidobacteriaceae bacterium]|nr:SDR family oxidoreductase [Acidobacteriaceae bacterium]